VRVYAMNRSKGRLQIAETKSTMFPPRMGVHGRFEILPFSPLISEAPYRAVPHSSASCITSHIGIFRTAQMRSNVSKRTFF
jgi:hypothetical protein